MKNQPSIKERRKKWNPSHPLLLSKSYEPYRVTNVFQAQAQKRIPMMFVNTELLLIALNNHLSFCISNNINDFIKHLTPKRIKI